MNRITRIELAMRWSFVNFILRHIVNPSISRIMDIGGGLAEVASHDKR